MQVYTEMFWQAILRFWVLIFIITMPVRIICQFSSQKIITSNAIGLTSVHAADLDGDGDVDVLSSARKNPDIAWYENLGSEIFTGGNIIPTCDICKAAAVRAEDFDNDGDLDVVSVFSYDGIVAWNENLGNGAFSEQKVLDFEGSGLVTLLHTVDLNGDGNVDIISGANTGQQGPGDIIFWFESHGNGSFTSHTITNNVWYPSSVDAADINSDGHLDVVVYSTFQDEIIWFENVEGLGAFEKRIVCQEKCTHGEAIVMDVDEDGDVDILATASNGLDWFENVNGLGEFAHRQLLLTSRPKSMYVVDLDNDGDDDIVAANSADEIVWFENRNNAEFIERTVNTEEVNSPVSVYAADLNGDGYKDILSASEDDKTVVWYKNTLVSSTEEKNIEKACTIYPNPAKDLLHVEVSKLSEYKIMFFNSIGNTVLEERNASTIDVSALPMGLYFVQVLDFRSDWQATRVISILK